MKLATSLSLPHLRQQPGHQDMIINDINFNGIMEISSASVPHSNHVVATASVAETVSHFSSEEVR